MMSIRPGALPVQRMSRPHEPATPASCSLAFGKIAYDNASTAPALWPCLRLTPPARSPSQRNCNFGTSSAPHTAVHAPALTSESAARRLQPRRHGRCCRLRRLAQRPRHRPTRRTTTTPGKPISAPCAAVTPVPAAQTAPFFPPSLNKRPCSSRRGVSIMTRPHYAVESADFFAQPPSGEILGDAIFVR
jgi:hypothetical protein